MEVANVMRIIAPPDWGEKVPPLILQTWVDLVIPYAGEVSNMYGSKFLLSPQKEALDILKSVPINGPVAYYWFRRRDYPCPDKYFYFGKECCVVGTIV